ncbi:MAG: hypothetical protein LC659_13365, partial [Myxococcales bacterium]|nr:hypothetical protein [Myxococcales bacterium]
MNHELHAAGVVEEALGDHARLRRHDAERLRAFDDVLQRLLRGAPLELAVVREQRQRRVERAREQFGAQLGHLARQLDRARQPLAIPERDRRRQPGGVLDADDARFDAPDAP